MGEGARGLLLGSYASGAAFVLALVFVHSAVASPCGSIVPLLRRLLRFGLPTMPAELSPLPAQLRRPGHHRPLDGLGAAGLYSLAVKFAQARQRPRPRLPARLAAARLLDPRRRRGAPHLRGGGHLFLAGCAFVVTGMWLLSRWIVRALAAPQFFDAYKAIGLISAAVTLYALYLVLVVILGRTGRTGFNFPAAIAALVANVALNLAPGAAAWDRRRRNRPGRLLPRRAGADVLCSPSASSRSPTNGGGWRGSPPPPRRLVGVGELLMPTSGFVGLLGARCPLARLPGAALAAASSPPRSARWLGAPAPPRRAAGRIGSLWREAAGRDRSASRGLRGGADG